MIQGIIVFAVVGAALIFVVLNFFKKIKSGKGANSCSGCGCDCELKCPK